LFGRELDPEGGLKMEKQYTEKDVQQMAKLMEEDEWIAAGRCAGCGGVRDNCLVFCRECLETAKTHLDKED
jgi:hypothetical protein